MSIQLVWLIIVAAHATVAICAVRKLKDKPDQTYWRGAIAASLVSLSIPTVTLLAIVYLFYLAGMSATVQGNEGSDAAMGRWALWVDLGRQLLIANLLAAALHLIGIPIAIACGASRRWWLIGALGVASCLCALLRIAELAPCA